LAVVEKRTGPLLGALTVVATPRTADEAEATAIALVGRLLPPSVEAWLFGRELDKYSHYFTHGKQTYAVFCFASQDEADRFMRAFDGEEFDARDIGRGSKWMF
jgi:hypothetical protein